MNAKHAIYATADGRLVAEDDPDVAYLVAGKGGEIQPKLAQRLGITEKSLEAFYKTQRTPENQPASEAGTTPPAEPEQLPAEPEKGAEKPREEAAPPAREETVKKLDLKGGGKAEK